MIKKTTNYKDSDLVPVVMIGLAPSVIVVSSESNYKNLRNFVDASKEGAGLHFATAGTGSTPHFVAELLNTRYGAKLIPVPYKSGSEGASAVMGGQVAGTSEASIVALPHIKPGGKFRALATTWTKRISVYPELSTAVEQGFPDLQIAHWAGIHAPAGVPPDIMDKLAAAVDVAMKSPQVSDRLKGQGIEPVGGTRASFNEFVDAERARLGAIVKAANMKDEQ
jgi:tripartite-type tricarboxylate transporter receptor subunit TctC